MTEKLTTLPTNCPVLRDAFETISAIAVEAVWLPNQAKAITLAQAQTALRDLHHRLPRMQDLRVFEPAVAAYVSTLRSSLQDGDTPLCDTTRARLAQAVELLELVRSQSRTLADVQPGGRVRLGDALLPCPFCGAPAERIDFGIGSGENEGGSCIACTVCQHSGPIEFGFKENFVSNWNRRARPAQPFPGDQTDAWTTKLARESAFAHSNEHAYLPQTREETNRWQPHEWVVAAIKAALLGRQPAQPSPGGQDARALFEAYRGGDLERDAQGYYTNARTAQDWAMWQAALAARQPVGQEPARLSSQTVDGELSVASAIDQVLELFPSSGRAALQTLAGLFTHPTIYRYAAPPAQAVDLGQLQRYSKSYSEGIYLDGAGDWVRFADVLALIDSQAVGK
ncbi:hypothetical protein [Stenotrophomonas maltophilia]|uniref:hypothetical protein n=1 Tax=Stenotrophomonas maltophilia TaxID=40324 RepID=UPI0021C7EAA8|nr:hypothetical protein [Stenotrophomonas maltophilia]